MATATWPGWSARASGADGSHESTVGYRAVAVATVTGNQTRWAGLGNRGDGQAPTNTTTFELGSITKLFTGLMLADAVDRGEVKLDDTLDMYLPALSGTLAGGVTLEELATHRSGLPAYADDETGATYEGQGVSDVASISASDVVDQSAGLLLSGRGSYQYSNLGVTLLGDALASAVGAPSWVWMVNERVLKPAGMRHTVFAASTEQVPTSAAVGSRVDGVRTPYSVGAGYFPAGTATFTTAGDLAAFARWILDGRAIGMWAMQPRYTVSETDSIGLAWMSTTTATGARSWHNGSVPGFTAMLRLDPAGHRAVAVLGNTDASVEVLGNRLLDPSSTPPSTTPWTHGLVALLAGVMIVACVFSAARMKRWVRGRSHHRRRLGESRAAAALRTVAEPARMDLGRRGRSCRAGEPGRRRSQHASRAGIVAGAGLRRDRGTRVHRHRDVGGRVAVRTRSARPAGLLWVALVLTVAGCVAPPATTPVLMWAEVTPAGVVPAVVATAGSGLLVAGTDASETAPAVARLDGSLVPLNPTEPYAATAQISSVATSSDTLYLLGGQSGGAHGNVRWTVWDGPLSGAVTSRPQEFFTFGGHDAGPLLGVVIASGGPVIVGSRGDEGGPLAALYTASGETWHQLDTPVPLRSGKGGILGFTAATGTGDQVVIVGDVVTADATGTVQTPALFHGTVGGTWTKVDLPVPAPRAPGLSHATAVACTLDACWVAGWSGGPMAWHVSLADDSVLATSLLAGDAPNDTDPTALVALAGDRPVVLSNAAAPTIAVLCHATWTTFSAPRAATAVAAVGSDLYVVAGTTPRLWRATLPAC